MTPYELVCSRYDLPFELYEFQQEAVNDLAPKPRSALYWQPGLGKTPGSTACGLYQKAHGAEVIVVLLPPILITTWSRWLARVKDRDGNPLKVTIYKGSPAQRQKIELDGDFILMSLPIFKKDYERICTEVGTRRVHVILDEAQAIKNVASQNYKLYRDFVLDQSHQLLTGTPLSKPEDAYAYIRLISPNIYRNLKQFEMIHVEERDFFDKPTKYGNLDLLRENLLVNADMKTKAALPSLPPEITVPLEYELAPAHLKLYREMAEQQLLLLPDDRKLDLTEASALFHAMGQIVMNWDHFSGDEDKVSAGFEIIEQALDELGGRKLIVFANYRMTNAAISKRFKCPGVWGDVPAGQKQKNLDRFINDPDCTLIHLQPSSAGVGVDGLQEVCSDVLFIEPPPLSLYTQAMSRVHRDGQRNAVTVRIASAIGTIQQSRLRALVKQEELVNPLQGQKANLRAALFGG